MINYNEKWVHMIFFNWEKFNLDVPGGYKYYWHDDLRKEKEVFFSRKCVRGSVIVWGGIILAFGKTEVVHIKGRHDSQEYIQMLKDHLLPFVETKEHDFQ